MKVKNTLDDDLQKACDSHLHIFDPRFPERPGYGDRYMGATVSDYLEVRQRLGTHRAVVVQAKRYGTDNTCLLDALAQLGNDARGIAVVASNADDSTLRHLDAHGVRGLRFSVWNPADTVMTVDMLESLACRIADLGWHVQLHMGGDQIVEHAALLRRLPCPIVFDHMARLPPDMGVRHPAWAVLQYLLEHDKCWVKLSGAYLNSTTGTPDYPEATSIAQAFVRAAPQRLVWGSDWPHVTETQAGRRIETVDLLTLLEQWAPDPALRHMILVENPCQLYGFD
ncbi:MAG: amidohydrolase family protein [Paralcaligenes sp.]